MLSKEEKTKIIDEFKQSTNDTGSAEVQIALLTKNIDTLSKHLKGHKKDFSSKRGLLKMVSQRRKFLKYLEKQNEKKYKDLIQKLGMRK